MEKKKFKLGLVPKLMLEQRNVDKVRQLRVTLWK